MPQRYPALDGWRGLAMVGWLCIGAIMLANAIHAADLATIDFAHFYRSAVAWVHDSSLYPTHNLNPPTFIMLTAPLGHLPYRAAWIIWLVLSAVACCAGLVIAVRRGAVSPVGVLLAAGACGALTPGWMAWELGQVTWLLVLPVALAWLDDRNVHPIRAGLWLGLCIAIKPPLAIAALCLPLSTLIAAGTTSIAISGLGIAIAGVPAWIDWLQLTRSISWIGQPLNASLWNIAALWSTRGDIRGISAGALPVEWIVAIAAATIAMIMATRRLTGDARWTCAILVSIAASPLGWAYYIPLAYLPAAASWRRPAWIAAALFALPMPIVWMLVGQSRLAACVVGSTYAVATLAAWFAWSSSLDRHRAFAVARAIP